MNCWKKVGTAGSAALKFFSTEAEQDQRLLLLRRWQDAVAIYTDTRLQQRRVFFC